jgi:POT family proton-dependent oligopeptide transporter
MAHASLSAEPNARLRAQTLRTFCISFGLQRHTYFILKAVSVFYFTAVLGSEKAGRTAHGWFFATLALAPVFVGAFVNTLAAQRRAVYLGYLLLISAFASLVLSLILEMTPWIAGALLIAGIGCFNVSFKTVFAASMRRFDDKVDVHFTRLYLAINAGSFMAPLLVGYLFRYDTNAEPLIPPGPPMFLWCGLCMILSLYFWWMADKSHRIVPLREIPDDRRSEQASIVGVLIVTLFSTLFWLGFELKSGRLNQDASNKGITQQIPWFPGVQLQSVNPLVVVLLGVVFAWLWDRLRREGKDPHPVVKMGVGIVCLGIGFFVLTYGLFRSNGPISPAWFIVLYVWHSIGELFFEPIGQGFVIANVPDKSKAFFLAVWEGTAFLAFAGGAHVSNLFDKPPYMLYLVLGAASLIAGALLLTLAPTLGRMARG